MFKGDDGGGAKEKENINNKKWEILEPNMTIY